MTNHDEASSVPSAASTPAQPDHGPMSGGEVIDLSIEVTLLRDAVEALQDVARELHSVVGLFAYAREHGLDEVVAAYKQLLGEFYTVNSGFSVTVFDLICALNIAGFVLPSQQERHPEDDAALAELQSRMESEGAGRHWSRQDRS